MTDLDEIRELLSEYANDVFERGMSTGSIGEAFPPNGSETAARTALLQRVEALREERDNLVRSRIDRAVCCAKVEDERDAALAALQEVQDEATRIDRSHVERIMVIAVIVEAALAPARPAALRPPENKEDPTP